MVFSALWRERNVTRAAKSIGMTQPALSRALSRMRVEFGDPLFVRSSSGVSPTARAIELSIELLTVIDSLEKVYSPGEKFDPSRIKRVFQIVTTDYFETLAVRRLIPIILKEAPGISLSFRPTDGSIPRDALEKGDADLCVSGVFERLGEGLHSEKIIHDRYCSVVRSTHPVKKWDLESFVLYPHVLMTPKGDMRGIVDDALNKKSKSRHIAIGCSNFLSAGWSISSSDMVLTAPEGVLDQMVEQLPLRKFDTPVKLPHLDIFQVWHARSDRDPAHQWLRQNIAAACGRSSRV
jgi:DNA-binding transcriptional LysR family regulator